MIIDRQGTNDISDEDELKFSTLISSNEPNFDGTDNVLEDRKTEENGIEDLKEEISENKDVSKDIIIKEEEVKFTYVESHSEAASEVQDDNEMHDTEEKQTNSNIIKVQENAKVIENGSELHSSISDKSKTEYISPKCFPEVESKLGSRTPDLSSQKKNSIDQESQILFIGYVLGKLNDIKGI